MAPRNPEPPEEEKDLPLPYDDLIIVVAELRRGQNYVRIVNTITNFSASATGAEAPALLLKAAWERLKEWGENGTCHS